MNKKTKLILAASVAMASLGSLNAQTIYTVAGNGTQGFSGDGATATSAELFRAGGVAVDGSGNIYIADSTNNRIRKVTASTGFISTIAGDGTAGFSGDGLAATSAELNGPNAVAVDNSGNVYIADSWNNRIRMVSASNSHISTVAGNGTAGFSGDGSAATSAELNVPTGVAVDNSGNVYIADSKNNRIRLLTVSSGNISTIAGNGTTGFSGDGAKAISAELNWPYGVAVDLLSSNFYIADRANNRIRMVTASDSNISTIAGNGTGGFSGDGAAATSAELNGPTGVAVCQGVYYNQYSYGNVYIADEGNNRIREIEKYSNSIITTVAGNGTQGYSGDGGAATSAELYGPIGVAVDAAGDIFIGDAVSNRTREVIVISGTNPACPNVSETYSVPSILGASFYTWTLPSGWTGSSLTNSIDVQTATTGGTITVSTTGTAGSVSVSMPVTVWPGYIPTITQHDDTLKAHPAAIGNQLFWWYLNGTYVFGASNPDTIYIPTTPGIYTVKLYNGIDFCGGTSINDTVTVTGINEIKNEAQGLNVYPNPSTGKLIITNRVNLKLSTLEVYNLFGAKVYSSVLNSNSTTFNIDLSGMAQGVYFIQVHSDNGMYTKKVVIE